MRPTVLEVDVDLEPRSITVFKLSFEKTVLRINEYPPDASRGMDLSSAVISVEISSKEDPSVVPVPLDWHELTVMQYVAG